MAILVNLFSGRVAFVEMLSRKSILTRLVYRLNKPTIIVVTIYKAIPLSALVEFERSTEVTI